MKKVIKIVNVPKNIIEAGYLNVDLLQVREALRQAKNTVEIFKGEVLEVRKDDEKARFWQYVVDSINEKRSVPAVYDYGLYLKSLDIFNN